jgi:hypothetical protein
MPAPKRVPDSVVLKAITDTRGNVTAAADLTRMSRQNLSKRLEALGVNLAALRAGEPQPPPPPAQAGGLLLRRKKVRPIHLSLEIRETLRQGKFDLQAKMRAELEDSDVLAAFVRDAFPGWLRKRLEG